MGMTEYMTASVQYFQTRVREVEWMYKKILELMVMHAELETKGLAYTDCHARAFKDDVARCMHDYYRREFSSEQHKDVWRELSDLYCDFPISDRGVVIVNIPYTVAVNAGTSMAGVGVSLLALSRDYEKKMRDLMFHGTRLFDHLVGLMIAQYLLAVEKRLAQDITDRVFVQQLLSEIFRFRGHLSSHYDYREIRHTLREGCLTFYLEGCNQSRSQ